MSRELDRLDVLWPNRDIFQGSARAYLRYCEENGLAWNAYEKPLWTQLFRQIPNLNLGMILDLGSGPGKLIDTLIEAGADPRKILAVEPNPILMAHLHGRNLGVGCVADDASCLGQEIFRHQGLDMITANMVVNHIPTEAFETVVSDVRTALKPGGLLAYSIPNPLRKALQHQLDVHRNAVVEEEAPWGGLVRYHHRSMKYQADVLRSQGFVVSPLSRSHPNPLYAEPEIRRVLVIAQKSG